MERRINIETVKPDAWKSLYSLAISISKSSLSPILKHLIKLRVSQVNSCAFCINMHTKEALQVGETQQRLFLLSAWRETDHFTEEEKAALAVAEEVTLIHQHGVSDETYKQAQKFFNEEKIAEIILESVMMNAWNRIAVSSKTPVER
ncbi:MAG: carboxymuconolactone decarboxylase family protein [Bacteroidetes bacterium]|nr:carboxymuconolactone decarboxylase family protein [Bacteroidota bacterium]